MKIGVVLAAAGRGERLGAGAPKAYLALGGEMLLRRALRPFLTHPAVADVAVVVGDPSEARAREVLGDPRVRLVQGGAQRQDSVRAGIAALGEVDLILVHDAARPFVTRALIDAVADAALQHGAAVPAIPVPETVKRIDGAGFVEATVPREGLRLAQTPQGFRAALLRRAHAEAAAAGRTATDDAALVELLGERVWLVPGDPHNIKITSPADRTIAEAILAASEGAGRA
jgi:2-C-methyl-D-erythritol 4-phosphate cytidylyltransferase